jgi:hypothetical protein
MSTPKGVQLYFTTVARLDMLLELALDNELTGVMLHQTRYYSASEELHVLEFVTDDFKCLKSFLNEAHSINVKHPMGKPRGFYAGCPALASSRPVFVSPHVSGCWALDLHIERHTERLVRYCFYPWERFTAERPNSILLSVCKEQAQSSTNVQNTQGFSLPVGSMPLTPYLKKGGCGRGMLICSYETRELREPITQLDQEAVAEMHFLEVGMTERYDSLPWRGPEEVS